MKVLPLLPTVLLCVLGTAAFGTDLTAPADFTISTNVAAPAPERFGINLREPFDYNNYTFDPAFEPITIRRQHTATGGGANYIVNDSGATTSNWRQLADGFFDGATVRVYRPSATNGALQFVRSATVTEYLTDGFRRLQILPVTTNQFTDTTAVPGVTYEYQVRAVNTSMMVSANYSGVAGATSGIATAAALAGSSSATNPTWTGSFYNRGGTAPAIPTNVTATPQAGAVRLDWTANPETDLAGYYVYRRDPSAPAYRLILDSNGPVVQSGDIYFVEMTSVNPPIWRMHDRLGAMRLNDQWTLQAGSSWPYGQPAAITRDGATVCPENGGLSSLRLDAAGSFNVAIQQSAFSNPQFHGGFYPALTPGVTYRVEVWLKQTGVPSGNVRFYLTQQYASVFTNFAVTSDWQKFTYLFTAPAMAADSTISAIGLSFTGPGTVWADNFVLYEDADSNPATYPNFALRPAAAQALSDYHPGPLRMQTGVSTGRWGVSMDDFLTEEPRIAPQWGGDGGRVRPDDPFKLPMVLRMARDCGGEPWIVVGSFMSEEEWLHLVEFLAAPYTPGVDTPATKPYAYLRTTQGQQAPWTDVFPRLFIEYANETWNPIFEYTFANGNICGQCSEYFFNVAKSSPYYAAVAAKMNLIVNGWHISTGQTNGFGHAASLASPGSHYNDIANYIGGWEAGIAVGGSTVNDVGYQGYMMYLPTYIRTFVDQHAASRDANIAAGHPYKLAVYEGGPGYANPSPGLPYDPISETYGKSLAAGVSTLDTYLYNSLKKIDPQCFFTFGGQYNWASHSLVANGYHPHTSWLALQMRNRYVTGAMLGTATNRTPTLDVAAWVNSGGNTVIPAMSNVPLIQPYAFRDGSKYSVFVLSRKLSGDTPVTLRLPFTSVTSSTLYKLTGDPRVGNSTALNINIAQETVPSFSPDFQFTMPPGSVYLYVFEGATTAAETNPTASIAQHSSQADPTTAQSISFAVHFSQPVTGFTASDIVIGGTAGATAAGVTEIEPFLGTDYRVDVSGMSASGTVTINFPPNAAVNASSLGNLAPSLYDNSVQFNMPPFVAYDDFNLAPSAAPNPPFLQSVTTGAGFSAGWSVVNFNAATYGDGYKLATGSPLTFANLRRTGNYAAGGRNFEIAYRALAVDGTFGFYKVAGSNPAVIGRSGTTLWMSALFRKDTTDTNRLVIYGSTSDTSFVGAKFGFGYTGDGTTALSGGTRYWALHVRNAANNGFDVTRSNVPVVTGQTALLVLKISFGATDRFDLYVNPASLSGSAPAAPDATWTTTGANDITFHTLGYAGGTNGANQSSIDEIRFGQSFAEVTPAYTPVESWRLGFFGSDQGTGQAADSADYDGDGLPNFTEYALGSSPTNSNAGAPPSGNRSGNHLSLGFQRNLAATDLTYAVEGTDDLTAITWTTLATKSGAAAWAAVVPGVTISDPGTGQVTVTDAADMATTPRRFLRLRVTGQ